MDNRPTIAEVQEWVLKLYNTCEQTITSEERKEQHKYAVMVQRLKFVIVRNWQNVSRS